MFLEGPGNSRGLAKQKDVSLSIKQQCTEMKKANFTFQSESARGYHGCLLAPKHSAVIWVMDSGVRLWPCCPCDKGQRRYGQLKEKKE
jgi:hypothetical protein